MIAITRKSKKFASVANTEAAVACRSPVCLWVLIKIVRLRLHVAESMCMSLEACVLV